jgi:hypothetical protein
MLLSYRLKNRLVSTVSAHHSVSTIKEHCIYFFAKTNFANVLVVLFLYFQNLGQFSNLLLKSLDFLLHCDLLIWGGNLLIGIFCTRISDDLRLVRRIC